MIDYFMNQSVLVQLCMLLAHALLVLAAGITCMRWVSTRVQRGSDLRAPESTFHVMPRPWCAKSGRMGTPNRAPALNRSLRNCVKS